MCLTWYKIKRHNRVERAVRGEQAYGHSHCSPPNRLSGWRGRAPYNPPSGLRERRDRATQEHPSRPRGRAIRVDMRVLKLSFELFRTIIFVGYIFFIQNWIIISNLHINYDNWIDIKRDVFVIKRHLIENVIWITMVITVYEKEPQYF